MTAREAALSGEVKLAHGTPAWFEMVGSVMTAAAALAGAQAQPGPYTSICLVERFTDGAQLSPGLVQGLRFEIAGGQPFFRVGALPEERGDITLEVTRAASHVLNTLRSDDPRFHSALTDLQATGELKVDGDLARLGSWFGPVHDQIVDRTAQAIGARADGLHA